MPQKRIKLPEQHQFVPTGIFVDTIFKGGTYSLSSGYTDSVGAIKDNTPGSGQKGRYIEYVTAKDNFGRDKAKRYQFNQSLGRLLTRPSDTDIYGRSQYQFLKNHPECEGSPNGIYEEGPDGKKTQVGVSFRELDTAKDAAIALRADRERNKAETIALNLDEETLEEIAAIIGYFGEVDDMMYLKVGEFAKRTPGDFTRILDSDDRGYKAIIRKAVSEGIFREHGDVIKWENLTIGINEEDAVATLRKDKATLSALQEKLGIAVSDGKKQKKAEA